jgi:hypothetical protein
MYVRTEYFLRGSLFERIQQQHRFFSTIPIFLYDVLVLKQFCLHVARQYHRKFEATKTLYWSPDWQAIGSRYINIWVYSLILCEP